MLHRAIPKPPLPQPSKIQIPPLDKPSTHPTQLPRVLNAKNVGKEDKQHINEKPIDTILVNKLLHIYNKQTGKKETLKSLLSNSLTKETWSAAASNEYGRLMDGNVSGTTGTQTMAPIALDNIPTDAKITYGMMVCDHCPLKKEKHRCRLVVGGNKLEYEHETAASAANLLEAKLIFNSTISTPNGRFFTMDIKDFFLSSKMEKAEYMRMHELEIPEDIMEKYHLHKLKDANGNIHFQIKKKGCTA